MRCFECNSTRIIKFSAKCPDGCKIYIGDDISYEGELPTDLNIGGPDELYITYCGTCGLIQEDFPLEQTELESKEEEDPDV